MGTSGLFSVTGGKPWKGWKQRHNGLRCVCLLVDFGCREGERDQTSPGQRISEEAVVRAKQKVRMAVKGRFCQGWRGRRGVKDTFNIRVIHLVSEGP